jgi:hypothetical protein
VEGIRVPNHANAARIMELERMIAELKGNTLMEPHQAEEPQLTPATLLERGEDQDALGALSGKTSGVLTTREKQSHDLLEEHTGPGTQREMLDAAALPR